MSTTTRLAAFDQAVAAHQAGRLAQAEALYRQTIALSPHHADAHRLLGLLMLQAGRAATALDLIGRALKLHPKSADALLNQGMALKALGRLDEAIAAMRRAQRLRPDGFDILYNLGNAQREAGRLEDAAASLRRAVALKPDFTDAHNNLGTTLRQLGRLSEAAASFRAAIALNPGAAPLHFNLAATLGLAGQHEAAAPSHATASRLAPTVAHYHHHLGEALARLGRHDAAIDAYTAALRLDPGLVATRLDLALALAAAHRLPEAAAQLRAAIEIEPGNAELHSHLGNLLRDLNDDAGAVASLHTALALSPDHAPASYALGVTHLLAGRLDQGWPHYTARFAAHGTGPRFTTPPWRGAPIAGQTLLLHAEQGLGDTIQFCRYVPLLADTGARIVLEVQTSLMALLAGLSGVAELVPSGAALPAFTQHCPLLDLPLACGTTLDSIPAQVPYLHADPGRLASWRTRCEQLPGRRVGLCWAGNRDYAHDELRSVPAAALAGLAGLPGISFVSLQQHEPPPLGLDMVDWIGELHDLADTAALIASLDLVISVDTAIVHLAGALACPTWLLNRRQPDWRWLRDRPDSPWYPTLRQFRQPTRGDWTDMLERVRNGLLQEPPVRRN